jgi:ABC-type Fe3+/spermidine/putrescine transport system ATPase subunit
MLELRDIFKTYEGKPLLRGISFSVAEGETVCLLGASGSGKSTLLRMITGLENPERGRILFNGIDLAQTPTHLRDFGLVFQDYGLFPHLNIFDNVAFGLKMRNLPTAEISLRVAALLEKVNLQGFEQRKVTDLSGGEQQRVALARALAPQPRLLMFDEPLGALDRTLKESLLHELRSILHETKIPAIYVTHDQDEAFTIADRILLLLEGEIVRAGTPAEVWSEPGSAWAARFLDAGNVLDGVVVTSGQVKTEYGVFTLDCNHKHLAGEKVSLLVKQFPSPNRRGVGGEVSVEIKLKVEDVLFKRDQFEVRGEGLVFQLKEAPTVGQVIKVKVEVECLA